MKQFQKLSEMYFPNIFFIVLSVIWISCGEDENGHDATGTFEAKEVIVSAEVPGKVLRFPFEEGDYIAKGDTSVFLDFIDFSIQQAQIDATMEAVEDKKQSAAPQVGIYEQQLIAADAEIKTLQTQLNTAKKEQRRIQRLYNSEAATEQQLDQINGQVDFIDDQIQAAISRKAVIGAQIKAARDNTAIQNRAIVSEKLPLEQKKSQVEEYMRRAKVLNPMNGIILIKYIEEGEFATMGKPLYKVADLQDMELRAYVDGSQLPEIKIGQLATVFIDQSDGSFKKYDAKVTWISDEAEFTPKSIQTKDERANLVYAIKLNVKNDGFIKIGMYGEVSFKNDDEAS